MANEIELKLALPPDALPALRSHPLIAACTPQGRPVTLDNTYYDTVDLALRRHRIAVRTRKAGRRMLQTVKAAAVSTGGLSSRPEWEQPFSGGFDFSAVDDPAIREQLERHAAALVPVFTTRFRRETRLRAQGADTRVLVMIDHGTVVAGEHESPICELELELVEGHPLDLIDFALRLAEDLPLRPDDVSKAERGFALHLGTTLHPLHVEPSALRPDMTPADAFRSLAFAAFRAWQGNLPHVTGKDADGFIRAFRAAQRRLRARIGLFAPVLPEDFAARWRKALRDGAARFAGLNALEALRETVLAPARKAGAEHAAALERLLDHVDAERARTRAQAMASFDPDAQGRMLLALMRDLLTLPAAGRAHAADLSGFAVERLEALRRDARRRLRRARESGPTSLRALRRAIRRLRLATEDFATLLPKKAVARYLKALSGLERALGDALDLEAARARLAGWCERDAMLREPAAFVSGWHARRVTRRARRAVREADALLRGKAAPWSTIRSAHGAAA